MIEVQLFQHAHQHNLDDNILVHPYDYTIVLHFDQMFIFSDDVDEIKDSLHKVIQSIQALDLTIEEYVIASALCLLISGKLAGMFHLYFLCYIDSLHYTSLSVY